MAVTGDRTTRVGAYRLIRPIGEGGMGSVHLAERADGTYQKRVAIKFIHPDAGADALVARFAQEQQILAAVEHPNIARLIDAGADDEGRPYIVMEYIDGLPITTYCDRARLSIRERVALFRIVCSAVQHAHQQFIVHRDLKPSNVLVTGDGIPKLLDFGIAKLLTAGGHEAAILTAPQMIPCTPAYASPEQLAGEGTQTSVDVYSLGVLLYELLTGRLPFGPGVDAQRSAQEILPSPPSKVVAALHGIDSGSGGRRWVDPNAVSAARRTTTRSLSGDLEGDLDSIIVAALRRDPRQRYHSVAEFSEDLRRHLDYLPVTARPRAVAYVVSKFLRRNRAVIAVSSLLAFSIAAGFTSTFYQWRQAEQLRQQAERRFDSVRGFADSMFQIERTIAAVPESGAARQLLVASSLQYLDRLDQQAGNDPILLRDIAAGYRKAGDALGSPTSNSLRNSEAALRTYQKSIASSERARQLAPADPRILTDLSLTFVAVGDVLDAQNDPAGARAHYQRARTIIESIATNYPEDTQIGRELAVIKTRLREASGAEPADPGQEDTYYDAIKNSEDRERLEHFLTLYPNGKHAAEVKTRLARLRAGQSGRRVAGRQQLSPTPANLVTSTPVASPGVAALLEWKRIPVGEFEMGCDVKPDRQCDADERPAHRVTISAAFELMATEVTLGQYRAYATSTGSSVPSQPVWNNTDRHPMTGLKWEEARAFCTAAGARLPTEAEWEYAARGGSSTVYHWGDKWDRTRANGGYPAGDGWDKTAPVKSFAPNAYGLFDMIGNVWEWVADWYDANYYRALSMTDPFGPSSGPSHVLRGGAYDRSPAYLRATQRATELMDRSRQATGFRCARESR